MIESIEVFSVVIRNLNMDENGHRNSLTSKNIGNIPSSFAFDLEMADSNTILKMNIAAGAIYSAQTILLPQVYLQKDGQEVNDRNVALTRTIGGGILGLTVASYLAHRDGGNSAHKIAIGSLMGALAVFFGNNVVRVSNKATNTPQAKIDLGVSIALLAANAAIFFGH